MLATTEFLNSESFSPLHNAKNKPLTPSACTRTAEDEPLLVVLELTDTKGEPVKNATVDAWQADSTGGYYFFSWTLRGKMTTDAQGRLEFLTIRPHEYAGRASHIHVRIYPADKKHRQMTSQMYICDGNDPERMSSDLYVSS